MSFGIDHRPMTFSDVIGCDVDKRILAAILKSGKYDNGYLFTGSHGIGKTTLAQLFARSILCTNRAEDGSPCNACESCRNFLQERNTAYLEVDAANNGTKESVELILKSLDYESLSGKFIVLFDEAHDISTAGKDALLKILEKSDRYEGVIFMFCTTESQKMPKTIRSRCIPFQLRGPTRAQVVQKLKFVAEKERLVVESDEALIRIADAAAGHYRDAENMLKTVSYLGDVSLKTVSSVLSFHDEEVHSLLMSIPNNLRDALHLLDELVGKSSVENIYKTIVKMLVDAARYTALGTEDSSSYGKNIVSLATRYGNRLAPVLDYVLSKDKLSDLPLIQSDVILIHYKFQRGDFGKKEAEHPTSNEEPGAVKSPSLEKTEKSAPLEGLGAWEKLDKVAEMKKNARSTRVDSSVEETVSGRWGAPLVAHPPAALSREIDAKFDDLVRKDPAGGAGNRV